MLSDVRRALETPSEYDFYQIREKLKLLLEDKITVFSLFYLISLLLLGIFGPYLTPYRYDERVFSPEGALLQMAPPSLAHPFGTTDVGYDVLSRLIYGARPTVVTGLLGGIIIISIGLTVGVSAGYYGGKVDEILMRFTDMMYSVPVLVLAIVLIALMGGGFFMSIVVIAAVIWRGSARVLRSQVLQIKERPFIKAAKATGASDLWIIRTHILPNVVGIAAFYFAIGVGRTIVTQAGLAFLGITSPFVPSWGVMVRNAYDSGQLAEGVLWAVPPGLLITLTVLSAYMLGRGYENVSGVREQSEILESEDE